MQSVYKKGLTLTQPDEICYRYVLQTAAHKHLPDLGPLVDETLARMRDSFMVPDSECYTAAIRTWKKAALLLPVVSAAIQQTSVRRTLELLAEMDVAHNQSTSVVVSVSTANISDVLEALTVSTDPLRMLQADSLLAKLEKRPSDGTAGLKPTAESYIYALRVWCTAEGVEKIAKAKGILWRVKDNLASLSSQHKKKGRIVDIFNAFVNVCGSHRPRSEGEGLQVLREALDAIKVMRTLDELAPNTLTYVALLDACAKLLPLGNERRAAIATIFQLCCDDGMVDENCLAHLREAASSDQYADLVTRTTQIVEGTKVVPEAWTRKALGGKIRSTDGRRTTPLSIDGRLKTTAAMNEFKMRRLRDKRNQNLLRGGRLQPPVVRNERPWRLYDSSS